MINQCNKIHPKIYFKEAITLSIKIHKLDSLIFKYILVIL